MGGKFEAPIPTYLPKHYIEALAQKTAEKLQYRSGDDIFEKVKSLGGRIRSGITYQRETQSGSLIAKSPSDWTIYLSPITFLDRDRFTVAHELGHLILHLPKCKKQNPNTVMRAFRYQKNGDEQHKRAEWEANWFAAAFLMPEKEFRAVFEEMGEATCGLRFGVGALAVKARAQALGLGQFL